MRVSSTVRLGGNLQFQGASYREDMLKEWWYHHRMTTSMLRIETLTSPPITIQDTKLHVRSQLVQLRFPTVNGGVIWNRPVAVVVRALDGEEKIVSIPDMTRTAMLTLAGLCLTGMFVLRFLRRKRLNLERRLTHG